MAEEAMLQAEVAVENIARSMEGRPLVKHKPLFTTERPKTLVSVGRAGVLVWGGRVLVGRFVLTLKEALERAMMSLIRGRPLAGAVLRAESIGLRIADAIA